MLSLPFDFLNHIFLSPAYFVVRTQHVIRRTHKMCVRPLFMARLRLSANTGLLVFHLWGSQKLYVGFGLWGGVSTPMIRTSRGNCTSPRPHLQMPPVRARVSTHPCGRHTRFQPIAGCWDSTHCRNAQGWQVGRGRGVQVGVCWEAHACSRGHKEGRGGFWGSFPGGGCCSR